MGGLARGLGIGGTLGGGLLGAVRGLGSGARSGGMLGLGPLSPGGVASPYGGGLVGNMIAMAAAKVRGDSAGAKLGDALSKKKKRGKGTVMSSTAAMPTTPGADY